MPGLVTVACKIPNGLILTAHRLEEYDEAIPGGSRKAKRAIEVNRAKVDGPAAPFGMQPKCQVIGGYAITRGIDADLWNKFKEQNKNSDMIRNNLIFAYEKLDAVTSEAKNSRKSFSGLEPLSTETTTVKGKTVQADYRWPKSLNPNVSAPTTDDEKDPE